MMRIVGILVAICVALLVVSMLWAALKFLLFIAVVGIVVAALVGLFAKVSGKSRFRSY